MLQTCVPGGLLRWLTDRIVTACLRSEAIATFAATRSTDMGEPEVLHQKFLEQFEQVLPFDNDMQSRIEF